jgi:hypothetical protein
VSKFFTEVWGEDQAGDDARLIFQMVAGGFHRVADRRLSTQPEPTPPLANVGWAQAPDVGGVGVDTSSLDRSVVVGKVFDIERAAERD